MSFLRTHMALIKWRISLFAALAAGLGYILKTGTVDPHILYPMSGVFVLAAGAGALNQYQERNLDARMKRTRHRPLPSGLLTPGAALCFSSMLILYGLCILGIGSGLQAAALGLFALVWYNGFYTHLKRLTAFAAVPGALVGAVPPIAGWTAAGGQAYDVSILAVGFFFFVWQVPHFWLLLLKYKEDYGRGGQPTLQGKLTMPQISRITFVWTAATGATSLLLPLFEHRIHPAGTLALALAAVWLVIGGMRLVNGRTPVFAPGRIILFMFFAMLFLSVGALLG